MNARIRYGLEANVIGSMSGNMPPQEMDLLKEFGRTVISFSNAVRHLPEEEGFSHILDSFGVVHTPDEIERGVEIIRFGHMSFPSVPVEDDAVQIPAVRRVEIVNPELVDPAKLKPLGDELVKLAGRSADLRANYALFIDHSTDHEGKIISSYNPLTGEVT